MAEAVGLVEEGGDTVREGGVAGAYIRLGGGQRVHQVGGVIAGESGVDLAARLLAAVDDALLLTLPGLDEVVVET
ncbi:hypothetical protein ACFW7J_25990, partial [Streptomyces sp. NPDC059525]|uniref:hypothetical protein n=1 Tax=Streptomyces sp. NPDC059525 TaxID=3346857 RepID=UPI0036B59C67